MQLEARELGRYEHRRRGCRCGDVGSHGRWRGSRRWCKHTHELRCIRYRCVPADRSSSDCRDGRDLRGSTVAYGICSYLSSDNAFTIIVNSATGAFDFTGTLATAKQDQGTDTSTTIPGLGDKAAGTGQEIVVQSGGKTIDIRSAVAGPSDGWPKSIALAKLVIVGLH